MKRKFKVLYTHQKSKKRKVWQDGSLTLSIDEKKGYLYDDEKKELTSLYINKKVESDVDLESDKYLIQVEEEISSNNSSKESTQSSQSCLMKPVESTETTPALSASIEVQPVAKEKFRCKFNVPRKMVTKPTALSNSTSSFNSISAATNVTKRNCQEDNESIASIWSTVASINENPEQKVSAVKSFVSHPVERDTSDLLKLLGEENETSKEVPLFDMKYSTKKSTTPALMNNIELPSFLRDEELLGSQENVSSSRENSCLRSPDLHFEMPEVAICTSFEEHDSLRRKPQETETSCSDVSHQVGPNFVSSLSSPRPDFSVVDEEFLNTHPKRCSKPENNIPCLNSFSNNTFSANSLQCVSSAIVDCINYLVNETVKFLRTEQKNCFETDLPVERALSSLPLCKGNDKMQSASVTLQNCKVKPLTNTMVVEANKSAVGPEIQSIVAPMICLSSVEQNLSCLLEDSFESARWYTGPVKRNKLSISDWFISTNGNKKDDARSPSSKSDYIVQKRMESTVAPNSSQRHSGTFNQLSSVKSECKSSDEDDFLSKFMIPNKDIRAEVSSQLNFSSNGPSVVHPPINISDRANYSSVTCAHPAKDENGGCKNLVSESQSSDFCVQDFSLGLSQFEVSPEVKKSSSENEAEITCDNVNEVSNCIINATETKENSAGNIPGRPVEEQLDDEFSNSHKKVSPEITNRDEVQSGQLQKNNLPSSCLIVNNDDEVKLEMAQNKFSFIHSTILHEDSVPTTTNQTATTAKSATNSQLLLNNPCNADQFSSNDVSELKESTDHSDSITYSPLRSSQLSVDENSSFCGSSKESLNILCNAQTTLNGQLMKADPCDQRVPSLFEDFSSTNNDDEILLLQACLDIQEKYGLNISADSKPDSSLQKQRHHEVADRSHGTEQNLMSDALKVPSVSTACGDNDPLQHSKLCMDKIPSKYVSNISNQLLTNYNATFVNRNITSSPARKYPVSSCDNTKSSSSFEIIGSDSTKSAFHNYPKSMSQMIKKVTSAEKSSLKGSRLTSEVKKDIFTSTSHLHSNKLLHSFENESFVQNSCMNGNKGKKFGGRVSFCDINEKSDTDNILTSRNITSSTTEAPTTLCDRVTHPNESHCGKDHHILPEERTKATARMKLSERDAIIKTGGVLGELITRNNLHERIFSQPHQSSSCKTSRYNHVGEFTRQSDLNVKHFHPWKKNNIIGGNNSQSRKPSLNFSQIGVEHNSNFTDFSMNENLFEPKFNDENSASTSKWDKYACTDNSNAMPVKRKFHDMSVLPGIDCSLLQDRFSSANSSTFDCFPQTTSVPIAGKFENSYLFRNCDKEMVSPSNLLRNMSPLKNTNRTSDFSYDNDIHQNERSGFYDTFRSSVSCESELSFGSNSRRTFKEQMPVLLIDDESDEDDCSKWGRFRNDDQYVPKWKKVRQKWVKNVVKQEIVKKFARSTAFASPNQNNCRLERSLLQTPCLLTQNNGSTNRHCSQTNLYSAASYR